MSHHNQQISIAASQVLAHVVAGGWLGASWPLYALKRKTLRRVSKHLQAVYRLAETRCWRQYRDSMYYMAQENFSRASGEAQ